MNHERVYQFQKGALGMPNVYSFIYTFKKDRRSCTVLLGACESVGKGKLAEHASLSLLGKDQPMPSWDQMCELKDLIWKDEEECYQIFPKKSEYVHSYGNLKNVMHIWRDI